MFKEFKCLFIHRDNKQVVRIQSVIQLVSPSFGKCGGLGLIKTFQRWNWWRGAQTDGRTERSLWMITLMVIYHRLQRHCFLSFKIQIFDLEFCPQLLQKCVSFEMSFGPIKIYNSKTFSSRISNANKFFVISRWDEKFNKMIRYS